MRIAKVSHDWGNNIVTIQGIGIVRTIPITKKLGGQTKRPEILMCYDFHSRISNEKKDVMFAVKLNLFSIGTIIIPIHIELVSKLTYIPNLSISKLIPKQHVEPICVLVINLNIPLDTIKQHLFETFFHPEVEEMIIDETVAQERIQDLTIARWTVIEEEQLTKVNLGTKEDVQQVKVNASLEPIVTKQLIELLKEFKDVST